MSSGEEGGGSKNSQPSRTYEPFLDWDRGVSKYLAKAFGEKRLAAITKALCHPSRSTCLRVNTLTTTSQVVIARLEQECQTQQTGGGLEGQAAFRCWEHDLVPGVVMVAGSGPHTVEYSDKDGSPLKEVLVSRKCGEAVLRGAEVFVPGVLACETAINAGNEVAVSMHVESLFPAPTRGTTLGSSHDAATLSRDHWFIGRGRALLSRAAIFRQEQGVAVGMVRRVYSHPSLYELTTQWAKGVFLQHLPSVVAAHVLGPKAGERILDMCASPGGKTTAIAILMKNQGEIIALDRSQSKVQQIETLAAQMGLTCITAFKMDATSCVREPTISDGAASTAARDSEEVGRNQEQEHELKKMGPGDTIADGVPIALEPAVSERTKSGALANGAEDSCEGGSAPEETTEAAASVSEQLTGVGVGEPGSEGTAKKCEFGTECAPGCDRVLPVQALSRGVGPATSHVNGIVEQRQVSPGETLARPSDRNGQTSPQGISDQPKLDTGGDETENSHRGAISLAVSESGNARVAAAPVHSEAGPSPQLESANRGVDSTKPPTVKSLKLSSAPNPLGAMERFKDLKLSNDRRASTLERRAQRKEARWLRSNQKSAKPDKLEPGSFDRVLLDAPCSALGLRPRLFVGGVTLQSLRQDGVYKRRFVDQAVRLVRPGGVIVYSTCTLNPGENEALVRYALDTYPCLRLVPQEPRLGGPGLVGGGDVFDGTGYREWLRSEEQNLVQRFDPDGPLDTIGFFIAKFEKLSSNDSRRSIGSN